MATAARLEHTLSGGISSIKDHMKQMQSSIKEHKEKADRNEAAVEKAKHVYLKAYGRQQAMREKRTDTEEKLEKSEEKLKEITRRVQEKETFLEESRKFNKNLKNVVPEEGEVAEMEAKLKVLKEAYNKNYERYQRARNLKIELEQKVELAESHSHEKVTRMKAMKLELEYNLIEEGRRTEGCKGAIDSAFKSEKSCLDLQHGLDDIVKRKDVATQAINGLESKISKVESSLDTINFDRRRTEATIKEILLNIKRRTNNQ